MKKLYILLFLIISASFFSFGRNSQIVIDGNTREYMVIVPETLTDGPHPLIIFLHELGGKIYNYETIAQQMANATSAIMLLPQALDEQNQHIIQLNSMMSDFGYPSIPVSSIWNAGISVPLTDEQAGMLQLFFPEIAAAGKIVLNADVNDINFLNSIIDETKGSYDIDPSRIYMFGASMGGAMTYKYAYSENAQVSAIAVISGFIGAEVDHSKTLDIPVCIFHSEDDEVVPYYGGMFNQPIPGIVAEFIQKYRCTEFDIEGFPDIANDGITVQVSSYNCDPSKAFKFYLLSGASHSVFMTSDYQTGPNDMDYMTEVWKFFEETKSSQIEDNFVSKHTSFFYPNPAKENISFSISGNYELNEITGKSILKGNATAGETFSIGNIPAGLYIITLKSVEGSYTNKLIIK